MKKMIRPFGEALFRAPLLKWCPACGGLADYWYAEDGRKIRVECERCGMRTPDLDYACTAGETWNRRISNGARLVTLHELMNSEFGYAGEDGGAAVWLETANGHLRAVILHVGQDFGEMSVTEVDAHGERREWSRQTISVEGVKWRLWDRMPTESDKAEWTGEAWRPSRAMPKLYEEEGDG